MRVLIVEDDAKLARFLVKILREEGYEADVCRSGSDAMSRLQERAHDLVILDWMLPDRDGLSVCQAVRSDGVSIPILMLTARGELKDRVLGLESGADDYLVKPFEVEELLARVRALWRRACGAQPVRLSGLAIDAINRRVLLDGQILDLTAREYGLLVQLASQPERIMTRAELLASVWDTSHDPGTNVVEVHVSRLRDKLGARAWMIETVRGRGYRFRFTEPSS